MERLQALKDELCKTYTGINVHTVNLDVREKKAIDAAIESLPMKHEIDCLVNNAGLVIGVDPLKDVSEEAYDTMFDTNVKGLVFVTQAVLPYMLARQSGHIINIGSVAGILIHAINYIISHISYRQAKLSQWQHLLW